MWDRACKDCHSNETEWPVWSYIAPGNFLIRNHVTNGRQELNVSTGAPRGGWVRKSNDVQKEITQGGMPDPLYVPLHPNSRLTADEKAQLIAGIKASFALAK